MNKFKNCLSARSKNGIPRCFGRQVIDTLEIIAAAGPTRSKMTNELGPKSLREIAEMLYQFGYVECSYEWIGSKIK